MIDQNVLLSNQIAGFFDHQYLWKETINALDFLHINSYQRKIVSQGTSVGWMWPGVSSHSQVYYSDATSKNS